jgi:hypothetical protein
MVRDATKSVPDGFIPSERAYFPHLEFLVVFGVGGSAS